MDHNIERCLIELVDVVISGAMAGSFVDAKNRFNNSGITITINAEIAIAAHFEA